MLASLTYDADGNLKSRSDTGLALSYDALNRLVSAARTGQATQSYVYDDQGRRISKTVGATTTNYLYDGQDLIAEYGATWGLPTAQYLPGPSTDHPIERMTATSAQYYHADGLGSVVAATDNTGVTVGTQRFDAWGNVIASTGTIPHYGYTGREPDETGLVYYRARYYDPSLGRFTQRDPSGLGGGINLYAYVSNNPVNLLDPSGLLPKTLLADAGAGSYYTNSATLTDVRGGFGPEDQSLVKVRQYDLGTAAQAAGQAALGFIPGYDLYQASKNPNASALDYAVGVLGVVPGVGKEAGLGVKAAEGVVDVAKRASQLGREGEAAVRSVYDIGKKQEFVTNVTNGRTRIPDGTNLKAGTLSEVKNTQYQGFIQQLRDYSDIAQREGLRFNLYVRPDTQLSRSLQDAIDSGLINRFNIPQ